MRMDALRSQGHKVVLVGDYNIAPAAIDSCDPGTGAEFTAWLTRRDRALLRSHLQEHGGSYTDVFRKFHPDRYLTIMLVPYAILCRIDEKHTAESKPFMRAQPMHTV